MLKTLVPALVGLTVRAGSELAAAAGLELATADPIAPLRPSGTIVAQEPLAGISVPVGGEVLVEVQGGDDDRGGGTALTPDPAPLEPTGQKLPG